MPPRSSSSGRSSWTCPQLLVDDARAAMAVAADAFFGEPTRSLEVVGVTGTNGKTTTAFLLRSVLDAAGRQPGLVGTIEWVVGGVTRPAPHTTPEAIDLQRLFREMLDAGDRSVAIEASSHGLDAAPARPRPLRRARLHEPLPGPSRPARVDGGLLPGEAAALHRRPAAAGSGQRRRRARAPARARARRGAARAARHLRPHRRRRDPRRGARARRAREPFPRRRDRARDAAARAVQRRKRARRRSRRGSCSTSTRTSIAAGIAGDAGRAGTVRGDRRGPAVRGHRRLRAHTGLARHRPAGGARARRGPGDLRLRRRRRP